jgi:hypothetical protein
MSRAFRRICDTASMVALVRMRENPVRTVGKDGQASSVIRQTHAPGDTKKALPSLL